MSFCGDGFTGLSRASGDTCWRIPLAGWVEQDLRQPGSDQQPLFYSTNGAMFCWLALNGLSRIIIWCAFLGGAGGWWGWLLFWKAGVTKSIIGMALHPLWHTVATPSGVLGTAVLLGFMSVAVAYSYW